MCLYRNRTINYTSLAILCDASAISYDITTRRMGCNETYNQRATRKDHWRSLRNLWLKRKQTTICQKGKDDYALLLLHSFH